MESKEPAQINLSDDTDPEFQSINFKNPKTHSLKKTLVMSIGLYRGLILSKNPLQ